MTETPLFVITRTCYQDLPSKYLGIDWINSIPIPRVSKFIERSCMDPDPYWRKDKAPSGTDSAREGWTLGFPRYTGCSSGACSATLWLHDIRTYGLKRSHSDTGRTSWFDNLTKEKQIGALAGSPPGGPTCWHCGRFRNSGFLALGAQITRKIDANKSSQ